MKKAFLIAAFVVAALSVPLRASAQVDVFPQCGGTTVSNSAICRDQGKLFGANSIWNKILNGITYVAGAAAVLIIIIGGVKYILSNGDQSQITSGKNTILYAVIGLILTVMANAIINFVLTNI